VINLGYKVIQDLLGPKDRLALLEQKEIREPQVFKVPKVPKVPKDRLVLLEQKVIQGLQVLKVLKDLRVILDRPALLRLKFMPIITKHQPIV